jgi:hypothetical protein
MIWTERPTDQRSASGVERQRSKSGTVATATELPLGNKSHANLRIPQRYQIRGELGRGGMGTVYHAYDRSVGSDVALKVLHGYSPENRLSLKTEFRALRNIVHPNLVSLYELTINETWCFFTMELVRGADIATRSTLDRASIQTPEARFNRFRDLSYQLALALSALHTDGKLHRDIKPSNALVTDAGRVVLLDFGLVAPLVPLGGRELDDFAGSLPYMSPEQLAGEPLTAASDWYSFGLTLHEAATGALPKGAIHSRLSEAPALADVEFEPKIKSLIQQLLSPKPERRPSSSEILACLGGRTEVTAYSLPPRSRPQLVGRETELTQLRALYESISGGLTQVVRVPGTSGIGKSALLNNFCEEVGRLQGTLLLRSRCHPQEALAFNAVDGLIDELSSEVGSCLSDAERQLESAELAALAQVFPVLARALDGESPSIALDINEREKRRLAFGALRTLLGRIAVRWHLVVWIDDVQWGDEDSGSLLRDLLLPEARPRMLLVLTYRTEDEASSRCLEVLREDENVWGSTAVLPLTPLDETASTELFHGIVGESFRKNDSLLSRIVQSAGGSPFFVGEFARYLLSGGEERGAHDFNLDDIVRGRLSGLTSAARAIVEILAVAGAPLDQPTALRAAGLGASERGTLADLERLSIIRTTEMSHHSVEFYHHRLREGALLQLSIKGQRARHLALANALLAAANPNALVAVEHFEAAGDLESVRRYVFLAANHALKVLAFERAARLFRRALELEVTDAPRHELLRRLAIALGSAGYGRDSGDAFLEAARLLEQESTATSEQLVNLRQNAAEQFIQCGHFQQGTETIRQVLSEFSVELPVSRPAALRKAAGLRLLSLATRARGRPEDSERQDFEYRRFDVLMAATSRLAMVDYALCSYASARCLLDALKMNEPSRLSRALALEAAFLSTLPHRWFQERSKKLLAQAEQLVLGPGCSEYDAISNLSVRAITSFYQGEFRATWKFIDEAMLRLRTLSTARTWEEAPWQMWSLIGLALNGELKELIARVRVGRQDAALRDDRHIEQNISLGPPSIAWLALDAPDEALRRADKALSWAPATYTAQHYQHYVTSVECDLYRGNPMAAWDRTLATWESHKREHFLELTFIRGELLRSRGRAALATAAYLRVNQRSATDSGHTVSQLLDCVTGAARQLSSHKLASASGFSELLQAGLANASGKPAEAALLLEAAVDTFHQAGMQAHREIARYCLGSIQPHRHQDLVRAEVWLREQGVVNPLHFVRSQAPCLLPSDAHTLSTAKL